MGLIFYRVSLLLYQFILWVSSFFNRKAKKFIEGRSNLFVRLERRLSDNNKPVAWFHCASLGEFEQGRPILESYKEQFPDHFVLLTFFSPSGYEVRKNYAKADYVSYLPIDSPNNARKFISIVNPVVLFLVKYEFWYFYIKTLKEKNVLILSVSSIFRKGQIYFKWYGGFHKSILERVNHFFVQDAKSKALLENIGITQSTVSGDSRFDRVVETSKQDIQIDGIKEFKSENKLMVIGSAWPEDMSVLIPLINSSDMKFIVAPHEISDSFLKTIESQLNLSSGRFSQPMSEWIDKRILIVDSIGLLSKLYSYADFAFVGGAFGSGLHNILEAAVFGIPVFFGNKEYDKFKEATDLINLGGAFAVGDFADLKKQFDQIDQLNTYETACEVNKTYVHNRVGATNSIMKFIKKLDL